MRVLNFYLYLIFTLSVTNCLAQKVISKPIPNNPTSYIFKTNINSVQVTLEKGFFKYSSLKFEVSDVYYNGTRKKGSWPDEAKEVLIKEVNKYDVWMRIAVDSSDIYLKNKRKPFSYTMICVAHFIPVDPNTIKMEIKVLDSKIITGRKLLPGSPHFVREYVYKSVKPTTIEEYKIIQCLGRQLGVFNQMPALKISPPPPSTN